MSKSHTHEVDLELSEGNLKQLIREVTGLKRVFKKRIEQVLEEVEVQLAEEIEEGFARATGDIIIGEGGRGADAKVTLDGDTLIVSGEDILFVEFGAGVTHNPGGSPNPTAGEYGYEIGGYGKGFGNQPKWVIGKEFGKPVFSEGTPADMPIYYAVQDIVPQIPDIAEEVFEEEFGKIRRRMK